MNRFTSPNGYAVELNNCLTEARDVAHRRSSLNLAAVDRELAAGYVVVIRWDNYYCKATDALAGEVGTLVRVCHSREQASEWVEEQYDDADDECRYEIRGGKLAPAVVQAYDNDNDEIPF